MAPVPTSASTLASTPGHENADPDHIHADPDYQQEDTERQHGDTDEVGDEDEEQIESDGMEAFLNYGNDEHDGPRYEYYEYDGFDGYKQEGVGKVKGSSSYGSQSHDIEVNHGLLHRHQPWH